MMHKWLTFILTLFCVWIARPILAQEGLYPLRYNETIREQLNASEQTQHATRDNITRKPFVYIIDTLPLPFFDDFSTNRIKVYDAEKDEDRITLKVLFGFTVNGQHPAELDLVYEPTFSVIKPTSGPLQYDENPKLYVTYYDSVGEPVAYDTGWTTIITEFDQSLGIVSYDTIEAETTLINTFDTLYLVDDDRSLWVTPGNEAGRGGAFINNSFARNVLTQGVASFDGVDARGVPYDISSSTAQGPADTLESKPLRLLPEMKNVFLSFVYQAGGNGNEPEEEDTLVLEFYDVAQEKWTHAWSRSGELDEPDEWSSHVWLRIDGDEYLQPGFKFRFRNYATLSAQMDLWHIDYIRIDTARDSTLLDTVFDVAFTKQMSSFTGKYTHVPWSHYLDDPMAFQEDTTKCFVRNLGVEAVRILSLDYAIKDESNATIQSFSTTDPNLGAGVLKQYGFIQPSVPIFPDNGSNTAAFDIATWYSISGFNDERINDTITSTQEFNTWYAYDDGTAEQAYALTGAGLQLAYGFNTPVGDSLRGLQINFPQVLEANAEDLSFELMVWDDTGSNPIYTSTFTSEPRYTEGNQFARYDFETPIYVQGDFYVGFRQLEAEKIYIGFDVNNNSSGHILYRSGNQWFNSSFKGSLLMRPDFGRNLTLAVSTPKVQSTRLKVYPNPTYGRVTIECDGASTVSIFSSNGMLIWSGKCADRQDIDLSQYESGFYFVKAIDPVSGHTSSSKLIIAK